MPGGRATEMRGAGLVVALAFAAAACTVVGPDYERPQVEMLR